MTDKPTIPPTSRGARIFGWVLISIIVIVALAYLLLTWLLNGGATGGSAEQRAHRSLENAIERVRTTVEERAPHVHTAEELMNYGAFGYDYINAQPPLRSHGNGWYELSQKGDTATVGVVLFGFGETQQFVSYADYGVVRCITIRTQIGGMSTPAPTTFTTIPCPPRIKNLTSSEEV